MHGETRGHQGKCHKSFSVFTDTICVSANSSNAEGTFLHSKTSSLDDLR